MAHRHDQLLVDSEHKMERSRPACTASNQRYVDHYHLWAFSFRRGPMR
jgi:hypothetical protein